MRGRGGKFLIRSRTPIASARPRPPCRDLRWPGWLGLFADEPPVFQFARAERHREVVEQLLDRGRAYRCS
jgi:glutamyl-tRNA synthetase